MRDLAMRAGAAALVAVLLAACGAPPPPRAAGVELRRAAPPPLPDTAGWGVHVLALARAPDGGVWAGTFDRGLWVIRPRSSEWERVQPDVASGARDSAVNSFAFGPARDEMWYGTAGHGYARSTDNGATWQGWSEGGAAWRQVAPRGIRIRRDSVYISTADGLRITGDGGATWRCIGAAGETARPDDGCTLRLGSLPSKYLLALDVAADGTIIVGHLRGLSRSRDGGRSWTDAETEGLAGRRVRALLLHRDTVLWVATEQAVFDDSARTGELRQRTIRVPGFEVLPAPRAFAASPAPLPPLIATAHGMLMRTTLDDYRMVYLAAGDRFRPSADVWTATWWGPPFVPLGGSAAGLNRVLAGEVPVQGPFVTGALAQPAAGRHLWLRRPIADADGNPYGHGTQRYGLVVGGRIERALAFNNPAGTVVRAAADGVVVHAGTMGDGGNAVVIRHDRGWEGEAVFTTYADAASFDVRVGERVAAGDAIARVGATGRATEQLRFAVHVGAAADTAWIGTTDAPPAALNPELWLEPTPGTGIVAGTVHDAAGQPVERAEVHGLVRAYPTEAPFSFAVTYGAGLRGSPGYGEHFAVGGVPAGDYTVGVVIDGARVWRRVRVAAGQVTWVELRP
jgi:hypothetical protein